MAADHTLWPAELIPEFTNTSENEMKSLTTIIVLSLAIAMLAFVGCSNETASGPSAATNGHDGHDHPTEGPHHGDLIELGNEEYHAEIVHDEGTGTLTIYVLDSGATTQVAIDATEVTINVKHDGNSEQFKLAASSDASDPPGKSSRFVSTDAELAQHLDEEGTQPRLVLTINGKSYRGEISHDHHGHDH